VVWNLPDESKKFQRKRSRGIGNEPGRPRGFRHVTQPQRRDARAIYERDVLPEVPVLLRVAMSLTTQPADAYDLVQDTLLRAWRSLDTFDGRYPRSWLLTIMRNSNHNSHRGSDLIRST